MLNPHIFPVLTTSKPTNYASLCSYIIFSFFHCLWKQSTTYDLLLEILELINH